MIPFSPFPGIVGGFVGRDQNRLKDIGLKPDDFFQLRQIHSDRIILLSSRPKREDLRNMEGDALLTDLPGIGLAVRTADCVPILIAHPAGVIGAVHSGWRGTKERILEKALLKMRENWKLDLSETFVSIGPAICANCYEVGEDVAVHFAEEGETIARKITDKKFVLDLKQANLKILQKLCIPPSQVERRSECTLCNEADFYSYRGELKRGEKGEGRNFAWVMRLVSEF